jgi:hypothetical protein
LTTEVRSKNLKNDVAEVIHLIFFSFPWSALHNQISEHQSDINRIINRDNDDGDDDFDDITLSEKSPAKNVVESAIRAVSKSRRAQFPQIIKEIALARSALRKQIALRSIWRQKAHHKT